MTAPEKPIFSSQTSTHVAWLDGLRGIAAFWVLAFHVQLLTGLLPVPILSWGELAVDLFMILSGFLMTHHYLHRRQAEPWDAPATSVKFWLRRFFRIAPLYYVLLAAALLLGSNLGTFRGEIASLWPQAATPTDRYDDLSPSNILYHVTFLFGAVPDYAFRTPLPDWSVGLEMQFYLAFPFIMMIIARLNAIFAGLALIAASLAAQWLFADFFVRFALPSFLPMKLSVFFIGIWAAHGRASPSMQPHLLVALGVALLTSLHEGHSPAQTALFLVIVAGFYYLMNNDTLPLPDRAAPLLARTRALLANKMSIFLGDTSYGVYLLHLLIILPMLAWLIQFESYVQLPAAARFAICLGLTTPLIYGGAWMLHHIVEKPGVAAGKDIIKRLRSWRLAHTTE